MPKKNNDQQTRRPVYPPSPTGEVRIRGKDDGCCGIFFLKNVLFVFNFILLLSGGAVLGVGLWTLLVKHSFVSLLASCLFTVTTYLLIITGGLTVILVFTLGCIGACRESRCALMTYAAFLMLVFMLEAATGVIAYLYEDTLFDELNRDLNSTMLSNYGVDDVKTKAIDEMHQYFRCCGAGSYADWFYRDGALAGVGTVSKTDSCSVNLFGNGEWLFDAVSSTSNGPAQMVPDSCCISMCRGCARRTHPSNIFFNGCIVSLEHFISEHLIILGAIGLGLCCLQIFGIIFSCCLAKKVKDWKEREKTLWR